MNTIEESLEKLVTFEKPSKLWKKWVCVIGGIEFSGENREELRKRAIQMLKDEIVRLQKE